MAEQHICDIGLPEYGDVDQRRITRFIDGVNMRALLGEKRDAFRKAFDGQEVKVSLAVKPPCIEEFWMRGQQTSCAFLVSNRRVDELSDERRWQSGHARRANERTGAERPARLR